MSVPGWICRLLIPKAPDVSRQSTEAQVLLTVRNSLCSWTASSYFPLSLPPGPWCIGGRGTTVQSKEHWAWNQEIRFKSQHRVLIHHVVLGKLPDFAVLMGPRATNASFLVEHHMTLRVGSSALHLNCDHTAPPLEGPKLLRPGMLWQVARVSQCSHHVSPAPQWQ